MIHQAPAEINSPTDNDDEYKLACKSNGCELSMITKIVVTRGTTSNKATHQFGMRCSWWAYCKTSMVQNAMKNAIPMNCILDQNSLTAGAEAMTSMPDSTAHPHMANIINEKKMIPRVLHQRVPIRPMTNARAAVRNEINNSDVNCPVNTMSSVY